MAPQTARQLELLSVRPLARMLARKTGGLLAWTPALEMGAAMGNASGALSAPRSARRLVLGMAGQLEAP